MRRTSASSTERRALAALKLGLSPLLLAQALWVRRRALDLPEAAGARHGRARPLPPRADLRPLRLLVIGDSSAAGVGVAHQDQALAAQLAQALAHALGQPVHWRLLAATGLTSADALAWLQTQRLRAADVLVTALGVNDVVSQRQPERVLADLQALHALVVARSGVRFWLQCGLPPMHQFPLLPQPLRGLLGAQARLLDRTLAQGLGDEGPDRALRAVPDLLRGDDVNGLMAEDGFHPGAEGYRQWAQSLAAFLAERWPHRKPPSAPPSS